MGHLTRVCSYVRSSKTRRFLSNPALPPAKAEESGCAFQVGVDPRRNASELRTAPTRSTSVD